MRFPTIASLSTIPKQNVRIFRECDVIGDYVEVGDRGHYVCVGVGVV